MECTGLVLIWRSDPTFSPKKPECARLHGIRVWNGVQGCPHHLARAVHGVGFALVSTLRQCSQVSDLALLPEDGAELREAGVQGIGFTIFRQSSNEPVCTYPRGDAASATGERPRSVKLPPLFARKAWETKQSPLKQRFGKGSDTDVSAKPARSRHGSGPR